MSKQKNAGKNGECIMTDSSIRPIGGKKPKGKAIATAAVVILALGAGYLWLTRTHADERPGLWVRLHKASLFSFNKRIYTISVNSRESEERLYLFNNPFIESEANLDFFVQYDKNLGGVQRLVLELGGIKYHIYKRHPPLPRMRRGPRPPAHPPMPLPPPATPKAPDKAAEPSPPQLPLFQNYAIRDTSKKEYLQNGKMAEALIKQGFAIAENKLAEAREFFKKDVINAQKKAKTRFERNQK
jgi:hypothetical protein